jgi:hypothetical protein
MTTTLAETTKTMTKAQRHAAFARLFTDADRAGMEAAAACTPTPMVVQEHASPLNDNSPVVKEWYVPQGVCGFAWVVLRPGTSALARWLKANVHRTNDHSGWDRSYYGGVEMWVHVGGQSMEIKEAYARAFARVFKDAGFTCYAGSRMD